MVAHSAGRSLCSGSQLVVQNSGQRRSRANSFAPANLSHCSYCLLLLMASILTKGTSSGASSSADLTALPEQLLVPA